MTFLDDIDLPTAAQDDLATVPVALAGPPIRRTGLGRLGVGTVPFTVASVLLLVGISTFVVMSPTMSEVGSDSVATLQGRTSDALAKERASDILGRGTGDDDLTPLPFPATTTDVLEESTTTSTSTTDAPVANATSATTVLTGGTPLVKGTAATRDTTTTAPRGPASTSPSSTTSPTPTSIRVKVAQCQDFATQPLAQVFFDANPGNRALLDGDGDGMACEQLPGRPSTTPMTAPPPPIPTVAEILATQVRWNGVHTREAPFWMADLDAFAETARKTPNQVMFFRDLSHSFPEKAIANSWARGMLPMVSFEPIIPGAKTQPRLRDITAGRYDETFRSWAAAAKAQGMPFAMRFAHEMNGDWYTWSDAKVGNVKGDYIPAWRHVHDLFREAGVTNVLWVWSVNRVDNLYDKTLARVYPGDQYVDWAAIDGYHRQDVKNVPASFDATFAMTLAELRKVAPTKPIFLTETAVGTQEPSRTEWIKSFFASLPLHPEIIGFTWFNDVKDNYDWRMEHSPSTIAAFQAGVADPRYGAGVDSVDQIKKRAAAG